MIDGAMDAAGNLLRAGIDGATVLRLALRARGLISIADPRMLGMPHFGDRERELLKNGLARHADAAPELFAFVADCIERVDNLTDMMAFYLHLTHVARMIELLSVAVRNAAQLSVVRNEKPAAANEAKKVTKSSAEKGSAKKRSATKAAATKKSAKASAKKRAATKATVASTAAKASAIKRAATKAAVANKAAKASAKKGAATKAAVANTAAKASAKKRAATKATSGKKPVKASAKTAAAAKKGGGRKLLRRR